MFEKLALCPLVGLVDYLADLLVDHKSRLVAVILLFHYIPAKEDLLFLVPECEMAEFFAHSESRDHLSG